MGYHRRLAQIKRKRKHTDGKQMESTSQAEFNVVPEVKTVNELQGTSFVEHSHCDTKAVKALL